MADTKPTERHEEIQFRQLLDEAISKPGTLMRAYSLFWNYSLGNQILALIQANRRGIPLGPIASFNRWKDLGRYVKRGEKAIELCMPVTCKRTVKDEGADGNETETEITFKRFVFRSELVHVVADRWRCVAAAPDSRMGSCTGIADAER